MRIHVVGVGSVGARVARMLANDDGVRAVSVSGSSRGRCESVADTIGPKVTAVPDDRAELVVLAGPAGTHAAAASEALAAGRHIVSVSDALDDVNDLLDLDAEARERGRVVAVGAGFAPGMSCVLARHAAADFDHVDEIHIARAGTGGPACARQHHAALGGHALDWRDHGWQRRSAGSGRELCWFPDPIGAADCYRAVLPDAVVLVPAFPGVARVTARLAATRRDRLTSWLPMLRPPHRETGLGAIRVEVRGRRGTVTGARVLGAIDRPAVAAAAVASTLSVAILRGAVTHHGAAGLASLVDPVPFLRDLGAIGVKAAVFEGAAA